MTNKQNNESENKPASLLTLVVVVLVFVLVIFVGNWKIHRDAKRLGKENHIPKELRIPDLKPDFWPNMEGRKR